MQGRMEGKKEETDERKNEGGGTAAPTSNFHKYTDGSITNIDAIACYGQKHTLRRLACFQWLQVGVEGNQVEGRKEEGIKGEKES